MQSHLIRKSKERAEFLQEFQRRHRACLENTWILKPSGGAHGDDIVVMNEADDIVNFLDARQTEIACTPWVVQKYHGVRDYPTLSYP